MYLYFFFPFCVELLSNMHCYFMFMSVDLIVGHGYEMCVFFNLVQNKCVGFFHSVFIWFANKAFTS
jgi:hypothetical protein